MYVRSILVILFLLVGKVIVIGQFILIPTNILHQTRTNVNHVSLYSLSVNNDCATNYFHTDLVNISGRTTKISSDYLNTDQYSSDDSYEQLRLKGNYIIPILRKLSMAASGSVGYVRSSFQSGFILDGGVSFYSYFGFIGYRISGWQNKLNHSLQFRWEWKFKKKYTHSSKLAITSNLNFGDSRISLINPTFLYTTFEKEQLGLITGFYENDSFILPMTGISKKCYTHPGILDITALVLMNRKSLPTLQVSVSFALRTRGCIRVWRDIPGNLSF